MGKAGQLTLKIRVSWKPPELIEEVVPFLVGNSQRGGKTYRFCFGGGEAYHKVPPPKPVLEASENGIRLVCARFL